MKIVATHRAPAHVKWGIADSPAGKIAVGLSDKNEVCRISFLRGQAAQEAVAQWRAEWPDTSFDSGAVPKDFESLPVLLVGSAFRQSVWRAMAEIPVGKAASYGEVAVAIGKPGASRAVGAACGANPVPYLVPCHRVVAANGGLGGFSGGPGVKEKLLKAEGYL